MSQTTTEPTQPGSGRHSAIEDAQGIAFGAIMAAFGIAILTHLGLITGQTAGLAVLISYLTGWPFGVVFFVVNLPFYGFGLKRFGWTFTLKTFAAVALLSGLNLVMPELLRFDYLSTGAGAVLFGLVSGAGLLALFRHGASLGGVGIVALFLQDRLGWRAGWVQLGFDAVLFVVALLVLGDWRLVAWSALGALVVNGVIAINHRRDRYIAT
ncbi:YitT family protein [Pararhodobacter sp. CCB-MM2]|uniref:YitT family protein n=1 Tax=Pararhodobacter sp. CCB-MM2 TaxID=1786003 RepID=UPI0008378644|nr:YitT family protein [Pararhodobacter sp. CCB-MM2]